VPNRRALFHLPYLCIAFSDQPFSRFDHQSQREQVSPSFGWFSLFYGTIIYFLVTDSCLRTVRRPPGRFSAGIS
jgi:hypothetical protein